MILRLSILFCCALVAAAAPGQVAAQAAKAAEPIGRLFFTPAQRASLDIARTQKAQTALSTGRTEEAAAPVEQIITYGGMVRRSDGKSTVWINNRPVNDTTGGGTLVGRIRPDGGISIQVPQSGRSVDLKVGQSIELLSGAIEEGYSRRPVLPEPKPAAKPVVKPAADAKPAAKAAPLDRAAEERNREEREQQRLQEAVSQALQETAGAKPAAAPAAPAAQTIR